MSFIESVKKIFNIGGIEIGFDLARTVPKENGNVKGKIIITSHGDRHVKTILVVMKQRRDIYRNGSHTVEYINIGSKTYNVDYTMKANDKQILEFDISCTPQQGLSGALFDKAAGALKDAGGLIGEIGSIGSKMKNLETIYHLEVTAKVDGTLLSPNESTQVKLI